MAGSAASQAPSRQSAYTNMKHTRGSRYRAFALPAQVGEGSCGQQVGAHLSSQRRFVDACVPLRAGEPSHSVGHGGIGGERQLLSRHISRSALQAARARAGTAWLG